jgi:hypothetical protein
MNNVFSILLVSDTDGKTLLSAETIQDTNAQVLTYAEARAFGFEELLELDARENVIFIVVHEKNATWINRSLEGNENVVSYKIDEVDSSHIRI